MNDMVYDVGNPGDGGHRVDVDFGSLDVLRDPSAKSQSTIRVWKLTVNEYSQWLDDVDHHIL
jgi:hypothetical protein